MPGDADSDLLARIRSASVVVVGHVREVRPSGKAAAGKKTGPVRITEHDPAIAEAVIDVDEEIKGKPPGKQVVVRFPTSTDVMWFRYPKLEVGKSGVFILQPDVLAPKAEAKAAGSAISTFSLPRKDDVLPVSDAARVRAVVKRSSTDD
ncbi:hypothetical protein LB577_27415 [Mesorhizobium sp. B283B1A]|uniref:hypothetical protein n=1 Tax=Mesorhizobium TaxID=68287 RepID=UPI001CD08B1B|nr:MULTISPECIES: hypothetical protein [Mesorhizobium]MCA0050637.1 hypothetical protein [Mesorhizobium sp. B283B1A]UQS66931.1 hypothetical protein M5D98_11640 [Mesorhizobium opportunistum]